MDRNVKAGRTSRVFISYPNTNAARVKAAFEHEIMRLLTLSPSDYVATADTDTTVTALAADAITSEAESLDGDADIAEAIATSRADELPRPDLASLIRNAMRAEGDAHDGTQPHEFLHGTHLKDALTAGRELIETAPRHPADRAICVVSAKAGAGKTTLLAHLAGIAHDWLDRKIAVIDFGCSRTHLWREADIIAKVSGADLVIIDNADVAPSMPDRDALWSMLHQELSPATSILIAAGPEAAADADAPWRRLSKILATSRSAHSIFGFDESSSALSLAVGRRSAASPCPSPRSTDWPRSSGETAGSSAPPSRPTTPTAM